mgnify:CR=1 FL=1
MSAANHEPGTVRGRIRRSLVALTAASLAVLAPLAPAMAQVTTVDPDAAIDADLNPGGTTTPSCHGKRHADGIGQRCVRLGCR